MAAAAVDVGYLASYLSVAETSLSALREAPTADLVNGLLEAVAAKAHEFDDLSADKMRVDIELEAAVHSAESHSKVLKATADKALKEVEQLRTQLQEEQSKRQAVENELQTLKSSSTTSQSEIDSLHSRIARLEEAKAEAFGLVDAKSKANDMLNEDLQKLHKKNVDLGQEIASLHKTTQSAQSALSSAKFKEQSLQQELDLARRNNEWFENELKTKSNESLKYRKEKGARIAELQRLNDEANSTIDQLTRSEQQLRSRLSEAQQKVDESLTKVQQLEEAAARARESFQQEIDSANRLVELHQQQTETHKKRTRDLEARVEQIKGDAENEIRHVRMELEQTRQEREQCEQTIQENEEELNHLRVKLSSQPHSQQTPGSVPQTPRNGNLAPAFGTPSFGSPGTVRSKGGLSTAQYMDELYRLKGLLVTEKNKNQELRAHLDDMMTTLEAKGPELQELQAEKERLEAENERMTQLADEAFKNRDEAKKAARKSEAAAKQAQSELSILESQLRDLSTQLQMLLFTQHLQENVGRELTQEEARQLERLEKGEVAEGANADLSDTHQFVSEQFVVFKNIKQLEKQNQDLLRLTRELANQMESEEALAAKQQAAKDHEELQKLKDANEMLKDEMKALQARNDTYIHERNIFRRIAQQKASATDMASVMGQSVDSQHGVLASIESNADEPDYANLLRELQANFDAYRNEQTIDRKTLKEQAQKLSEEKNSLHTEIARIKSQLTLASERYEMLHSNFVAIQSENKELQRRNQMLSESAAKQDASIQKLAEEHVEDRHMLESMRSENANLKAEKNLWKDIQERLIKDNESLNEDKSRLNELLTSQQKLQNERDLTESENKRRLEGRIGSLESDLEATKRKLSDQIDENKNLQLRKEFDTQQSQARIDELTKNLSQIREELVATKTARDHLQARVDELTIQLRSAEERAERLVPIPTSRSRQLVDTDQSVDQSSQIQELEEEKAGLQRDLDLTKAHLDNAKAQIEHYKEILQNTETDLQSLTGTQEIYRQEMEAAIATKDSKIKELQQRVEDLSSELSNTNRELSALRDSQAEIARRYDDEKGILEGEIKRLKGEEERYSEMAKYHQQDLRAQADIAAKAQQDYEGELLKHAEAARLLQSLRTEYNQLKTESASLKAEAESAKHTLVESERSWEERRSKLEQEISELKARRDDTVKMNTLLQQEYSKVTAQISDLQQNRTNFQDSTNGAPVTGPNEGLQELNNYLRREKEILEVQHELKVQEAKRLQQQLDYAQSQLDEARLKLEQERRSQASSGKSSVTHKELMEKLNELNVFRESSTTLRNELQQARGQLEVKAAKIEELESKIQPLEAKVEELEGQKTFMEQEARQLQEDRDRWQKRTQDILTKYGRADPEELEQFKQSVADLQAERDTLKAAQQPLQARVEELEAAIKAAEERRDVMKSNLTKQFKERSQQQSQARNQAIAEKNEAIAAKENAEAQLANVNSELLTAREQFQLSQQQKSELEQLLANAKSQVELMQKEAETNKTTPPASVPVPALPAEPTTNVGQVQQQLEMAQAQLEAATAEKNAAMNDLEVLRAQLQTATAERDEALTRAAAQPTQVENKPQSDSAGVSSQVSTALLDAERQELQAKVEAAEARVAELEAEVSALKAAEAQSQEKINDMVKLRSDKMKAALNNKLQQSREAMEKEKEQYRNEMEAEFKVKLDQERVIWMAENKTNPPARAETGVPATPAKVEPPAAPSTPVTATPTTGSIVVADLAKLGDQELRDFISTNATIKGIVAANIKKRLDAEKKNREEAEAKMKQEYEQKREQAITMEQKKVSLQLNMRDNKIKTINAKLQVVETAAKETPQRPVVEVWEVAKVAKAAPAANAQNGAASTPVKPSPVPAPAPSPVTAATTDSKPVNPFGAGSRDASPAPAAAGANPFVSAIPAPSGIPVPATTQSLSDDAASTTTVPQQQRVSSLPTLSQRGAHSQGRGRGVYQAQRGANRGGRGGGRGGLNPSAQDFAPGNKRPRESDIGGGNGTKRLRGGGPQAGGQSS